MGVASLAVRFIAVRADQPQRQERSGLDQIDSATVRHIWRSRTFDGIVHRYRALLRYSHHLSALNSL